MIRKIDKGFAFEKLNRVGGYIAQIFGIYQVVTQLLDFINYKHLNIFLFMISIAILATGLIFSYTKESIIIDYS